MCPISWLAVKQFKWHNIISESEEYFLLPLAPSCVLKSSGTYRMYRYPSELLYKPSTVAIIWSANGPYSFLEELMIWPYTVHIVYAEIHLFHGTLENKTLILAYK